MIPTISNYTLHCSDYTYTPSITNFETFSSLIDDAEKFSQINNDTYYIIDNKTGEIMVIFENGVEIKSSPSLDEILLLLANNSHK